MQVIPKPTRLSSVDAEGGITQPAPAQVSGPVSLASSNSSSGIGANPSVAAVNSTQGSTAPSWYSDPDRMKQVPTPELVQCLAFSSTPLEAKVMAATELYRRCPEPQIVRVVGDTADPSAPTAVQQAFIESHGSILGILTMVDTAEGYYAAWRLIGEITYMNSQLQSALYDAGVFQHMSGLLEVTNQAEDALPRRWIAMRACLGMLSSEPPNPVHQNAAIRCHSLVPCLVGWLNFKCKLPLLQIFCHHAMNDVSVKAAKLVKGLAFQHEANQNILGQRDGVIRGLVSMVNHEQDETCFCAATAIVALARDNNANKRRILAQTGFMQALVDNGLHGYYLHVQVIKELTSSQVSSNELCCGAVMQRVVDTLLRSREARDREVVLELLQHITSIDSHMLDWLLLHRARDLSAIVSIAANIMWLPFYGSFEPSSWSQDAAFQFLSSIHERCPAARDVLVRWGAELARGS